MFENPTEPVMDIQDMGAQTSPISQGLTRWGGGGPPQFMAISRRESVWKHWYDINHYQSLKVPSISFRGEYDTSWEDHWIFGGVCFSFFPKQNSEILAIDLAPLKVGFAWGQKKKTRGRASPLVMAVTLADDKNGLNQQWEYQGEHEDDEARWLRWLNHKSKRFFMG